jgi:hypothetical protein
MTTKRIGNVVGLLVLFGVVFYFYSMWRQTSEIETLCASYPPGTVVGNLENPPLEFGVQLMGPFKTEEQPGLRKFVFCAPLTMCDVSCALEVQNGAVTSSDYVSR